jgi:Flp pilus assembly protein TadD
VDRYTYVACIGWAVVAGGAVALGWQGWSDGRVRRFRAGVVATALVGVLIGWSVMSWRQAGVWEDGVTLWTRAVAVMPRSPVARTNLGAALIARRDFSEAVVQYGEAARLEPQPVAYQNLGRALSVAGRFSEAEAPFRRVVELQPGLAEGHLDLGTVLYNLGQLDGAVAAFSRAVELDPKSVRARDNLGTALWRQGRQADAAVHFRTGAMLETTPRGVDLTLPPPPGPPAVTPR